MTPTRPRTVVAARTLLGVLVVAAVVAVFPAPSIAAPATEPPPVVVGFIPPTVIPPAGTLVVGTGITVGTGLVGAGISAGATCGAVTGGTCVAALGLGFLALGGSFAATTAFLNWQCGTIAAAPGLGALNCNELQSPTSLSSQAIVSGFRRCNSADVFAAAEAAVPGSVCSHVSLGGVNTENTHWKFTGSRTSLFDSFFHTGSPPTYLDPSSYRFAGSNDGSLLNPDSAVLTRAASSSYNAAGCYGDYTACGIEPADRVAISTLVPGGSSTPVVSIAPDPRVSVHGMQRRLETTVRCVNASGDVENPQLNSAWFFEREQQAGDFDIQIPRCSGADFTKTGMTVKLRTNGSTTLKTVIEVDLSPSQTELQGLPDSCRVHGICPKPQLDTGTETCRMGSTEISGRFCTATEVQTQCAPDCEVGKVTNPNPPPRAPETPPAPQPPPVVNPVPPQPTPENPGEEGAECYPSGWGFFNPVDWILKPVKCALIWAFVPTVSLETRTERVKTDYESSAFGGLTTAVADSQALFGDGALGVGENCEGPEFGIEHQGQSYRFHPFSACADPMLSVAAFFNNLVAAGCVLFVVLVCYNRLVVPFGIEPIRFRD